MVSWLDMIRKPRKYKPRISSEKKRERLMDKTVATAIATDMEVERQWLETNYGIYCSEDDPLEKLTDKIREKWSEESLQILGEDEVSQESTIRALVNEIKKSNAQSEKLHNEMEADFDDIDQYKQSNPYETLRNLKREKIEQPGDVGKNNRPAAEDNIKAVKLIFSELAKRLSSASTDSRSSQTIAVEVDGRLLEMSPEAYQIFKKQREETSGRQGQSEGITSTSPQYSASYRMNPTEQGYNQQLTHTKAPISVPNTRHILLP